SACLARRRSRVRLPYSPLFPVFPLWVRELMFIDILGRSAVGFPPWRSRRRNTKFNRISIEGDKGAGGPPLGVSARRDKQRKGVWGMPGLPEAMKDAISCENPRGAAHEL